MTDTKLKLDVTLTPIPNTDQTKATSEEFTISAKDGETPNKITSINETESFKLKFDFPNNPSITTDSITKLKGDPGKDGRDGQVTSTNPLTGTGTQTDPLFLKLDTTNSDNLLTVTNNGLLANGLSKANTGLDNVTIAGNNGQVLGWNNGKLTAVDQTGGGSGDGDMLKSVYDPQGKNANAFNQDNMSNGANNKNYTSDEKNLVSDIPNIKQTFLTNELTRSSGKFNTNIQGHITVIGESSLTDSDLKTINGQSILGSGNIAVDGTVTVTSWVKLTNNPDGISANYTKGDLTITFKKNNIINSNKDLNGTIIGSLQTLTDNILANTDTTIPSEGLLDLNTTDGTISVLLEYITYNNMFYVLETSSEDGGTGQELKLKTILGQSLKGEGEIDLSSIDQRWKPLRINNDNISANYPDTNTILTFRNDSTVNLAQDGTMYIGTEYTSYKQEVTSGIYTPIPTKGIITVENTSIEYNITKDKFFIREIEKVTYNNWNNIKTINNQPIIGQGNITISGNGNPNIDWWHRHVNAGTPSDSTRVFFNGEYIDFKYNLDNGKLTSILPFPGFAFIYTDTLITSMLWLNSNDSLSWNDCFKITLTLAGSGRTGVYDGKIDIYNTADTENIPIIHYNWTDERIAVVVKTSDGGFNNYGYGTYTPW